MGKKRLRVEVLLGAAAASAPPPLHELLPDLTLSALLSDDRPFLLRLLPRADVYLQDAVEVALHPTLTRCWCPKGRRGQRLVEAPGTNQKRYGFGLVDWRDGWFDWSLEDGRQAEPFCAQRRRTVQRSPARGQVAIVVLDNLSNLSIHPPRGSKLLRALLEDYRGQLYLVYTPAYDPDANRIEWLWRALRKTVTHNHARETLPDLLADADAWARAITPAAILRQLSSPFAEDEPLPTADEALAHAA